MTVKMTVHADPDSYWLRLLPSDMSKASVWCVSATANYKHRPHSLKWPYMQIPIRTDVRTDHSCDILAKRLHHQQFSWSRTKAYFGWRNWYYSNSIAMTRFLLLKLSGNVESNPGPQRSLQDSSKILCACCAKAMRGKQNGVRCSSCSALFRNKCTKMSRKELCNYRNEGFWICFSCSMPKFSDSFLDELSSVHECDLNSSNEDTVNSEDSIEWFSRNVKGYYKSDLKIAHLNINVTFHAKTCTNGFPLNGWNKRPLNGLQTGHQAVWNRFRWGFERVMKYSERVA